MKSGSSERRLITVSGVGPKLAIKILCGFNSERVIQAIRGEAHAQLTHIPGVGKKLAERLVVELKDKLDDFAVAPTQPSAQGPAVDDVLSAGGADQSGLSTTGRRESDPAGYCERQSAGRGL